MPTTPSTPQFQPPLNYVPDPANYGWWYDPNGDASKDSSWWQQPPDGYVADLQNVGWWYNPAGDPNSQNSWWADSRVVLPATLKSSQAFDMWDSSILAGVTGCPKANIELYWPLVYTELYGRSQASRESCAGAIGTIAIETASTFTSVEEAFWLTPEARMAYYQDATQHAVYSGGPQYHGRGLIQLTHDYNYKAAGEALDLPLLGSPELVLRPDVAAKVFAWYWANRDLQAPANDHNWAEVRRRVQGGTAGLPRLLQIVGDLL